MAKKAFLLLVSLCCLGAAAPAAARSFTIDDLLHNERFIEPHFDPTGHWLVFARLLPLTTMARFDTLSASRILRARLYLVDIDHPDRVQPLLDKALPGAVIYGFSPNGKRLAIGRLDAHGWRLGIVSTATRAVRWFDINPDYSPFGQTLAWLSNDEVVLIANPAGRLPQALGYERMPPQELPRRWKATERGVVESVTVLGSGHFLGENPPPITKSLVHIDVAGGKTETLASGPFIALKPSSDRRFVALIEQGATEEPARHPLSLADWPYKRRLAMVALDQQKLSRPCPDCDLAGAVSWSRSGDRLAFVARRDGEDWPSAALMTIDAAHKQFNTHRLPGLLLTRASAIDGTSRPAIAWLSQRPMIYAHKRGSNRSDWYRIDGARAEPMTQSLGTTGGRIVAMRGCAAAMPTGSAIWCLATAAPRRIGQTGVANRIVDGRLLEWQRTGSRFQFRGDGSTEQALEIDAHDSVRILAAGSRASQLVIGLSRPDGEKKLFLISAQGQTLIASANAHLRTVRRAQTRKIRTSADGRPITSWLLLPSSRSQHEKVPLVVIPYPGQSFGDRPPPDQGPGSDRLFANAQIIAAAGYGVLLPGMPEPRTAAKGVLPFAGQLDPIVDAAIASGTVDPTRIALWGASYGGYAAAMIASQSCRYRSVIAEHGIYDLARAPAVFDPLSRLTPATAVPVTTRFAWVETGQGRMGVPPWINPSLYVENSPYYRAEQIHAPMMLIAADRDSAPLGQAEAMFSALFRQGKDAQLVTYWGEGHVIGSPANLRDLYRRVFIWLHGTLSELTTWASSCGASFPDSRSSFSARIQGRVPSTSLRSNRTASGSHAKASARGA